jgi:hypothetical protein
MEERTYKSIEVKLGNYIRRFEMRDNYIGTFAIDNKVFNVIGSSHSLDMLQERDIDKYSVLGTIIGLGEDLVQFNNNNKHIIVSNKDKDCSTVFTVENWTVVLITVLDKGVMHTSNKANFKETINLSEVG